MLNKEIKTPNFTVKQLINIAVIGVVIWFVFGNYSSGKFIKNQNKELKEKYDLIEKHNHKIDKELIQLKKDFRHQDSIDSVSKVKLIHIRSRSKQKQKDYEKAINNINFFNEYQLDSTIQMLLK